MGARRGRAATRRGAHGHMPRDWSASSRPVASSPSLSPVRPAPPESTGGTSPEAPSSAPRLSAPPPGVKVRPAPVLHSWRCVRACQDTRQRQHGLARARARACARAHVRGRVPGRRGRGRRRRRRPARGASGTSSTSACRWAPRPDRSLVAHHDGQQSPPSATALAIVAAGDAEGGRRRARPSRCRCSRGARSSTPRCRRRASYVLHGDSPADRGRRARARRATAPWSPAGTRARSRPRRRAAGLGRHRRRPAPEGRPLRLPRHRRRRRRRAGGQRPGAEAGARIPAQIQFLGHEFPIRGPHYFGEFAARFGGGRGHQGQDTFAACGTPLVAARGGVVKFKQYHGAAGHYLVIDGERTGIDYTYMHLRDAALVNEGDRVRTGQLIGYVGQTGRASGCHLHFEMWTRAGLVRRRQPVRPAAVSCWPGTRPPDLARRIRPFGQRAVAARPRVAAMPGHRPVVGRFRRRVGMAPRLARACSRRRRSLAGRSRPPAQAAIRTRRGGRRLRRRGS